MALGDGRPIIAHTPLAGTYTAGSTAATDYAATNAGQLGTPRRRWRSGASNRYLTVDLGAAVTPAWVAVLHTNCATLTVQASTDDVSYSTLGTMTCATEARTGRAGGVADVSGIALSRRYYRLLAATYIGGGDPGYAEIGVAAFYATAGVRQFSKLPGAPITYTRRFATTRLDYVGGGFEVAEDGAAPYLEFRVGNDAWMDRDTARADLLAVLNAAPPATPLIVAWNRATGTGAREDSFVCRRVDDVTFGETFRTLDADLTLREVI